MMHTVNHAVCAHRELTQNTIAEYRSPVTSCLRKHTTYHAESSCPFCSAPPASYTYFADAENKQGMV